MKVEDSKLYFTPGMLCKCSKLADAPEMYVLKKKEFTIKTGDNKTSVLQGIVCRYLDKNRIFHDEIFSTKDLIQI